MQVLKPEAEHSLIGQRKLQPVRLRLFKATVSVTCYQKRLTTGDPSQENLNVSVECFESVSLSDQKEEKKEGGHEVSLALEKMRRNLYGVRPYFGRSRIKPPKRRKVSSHSPPQTGKFQKRDKRAWNVWNSE